MIETVGFQKALISNLTSRDTGNDWVDSFEEYKKTQQLDSKPWAEEFVSNSVRALRVLKCKF